ncbi:MAG: biopolymer transporter ExbD [Candidatus Krumholzibacteriia bacterium]
MNPRRNLVPAGPRLSLGEAARPPLTSLVDMMVILLVFLLKSFSMDGQLVTPARDLRLPESTVDQAVEPALTVEVSTSGIALDGARVAALPTPDAELGDPGIAGLRAALAALPAPADAAPARRVNVQCDHRIGFAVLKRVLFTCSEAGYDELSLLVLREAR